MSAIQKYFREPFPGISHLFGTILSVIGLIVLLVISRGRPMQLIACSIYGASLILLYLASTLCHSLPVDAEGEAKLDRFDRCAIYCLIAGTYTPICLIALQGGWRWSLFGVEWGLAAMGIVSILWGPAFLRWVRTMPYIIMGWLAIVAIAPLRAALPTDALVWLFAGGAVYSIGVVVFLTNRPNLWPGKFVAHDLWHVLVLIGSICHFVMVTRFVV